MNLLANLRLTFRQIQRNPGFFAIAVAALALGIGANTTIFSAVEAVLLRPLPYFQPDRLVMVWEDSSYIGFAHNTPAPGNYQDWRAQNTTFTDMAALYYDSESLTSEGPPEQLSGRRVTQNFFDVLGVQPVVGRPFTKDEERNQSAVLVISYGLWQRHFGGEPSIAGHRVLLDGAQATIVGVMPKGFFFQDKTTDFWAPNNSTPERWARRGAHYLNVVARLKPGVRLEQAQNNMQTIAERLQKEYPETNAKIGAVVQSVQEDFAGDTKNGLLVLQVASVFVLLIACSNLANLLLARSTGRRREIAVRIALGATRRQIAAQMLTESLMLSFGGSVFGLAIGQACWNVFGSLVPAKVGGGGFQMDWQVLLFTAGIALGAGLLFGFAPALQTSNVVLQEALKEGNRSGESRSGVKLRDGLVVAQFGLAFALLVCAGLMIETIWNLRKQDLGFRSDHLLTMAAPLPEPKYEKAEAKRQFYASVMERVRALPGVQGAGFASDVPFTSIGDTEGYLVEGAPKPGPGEENDALYREVSPGYLEMMKAIMREGRALEEQDSPTTLKVLVVNEFLARRHWPGQSAIGKRIRLGGEKEPWWTVVGVVEDLRERGLLYEMKPAVYVPITQVEKPGGYNYLVVRTSNDPGKATKEIESALWSVDPLQPVTQIQTMDELIETDVADRTRPMILLGVFAGLALVLACIGVYGVLAYAVAQRTREIGVRMALGAKPLDVTRMILERGMKLSAAGLLAGAALAAGLSLLLRSLLFGVKPAEPLVYGSTAGVLLLVALAACLIPAQRAANVDPIVALRDE
jgi:predicted permease